MDGWMGGGEYNKENNQLESWLNCFKEMDGRAWKLCSGNFEIYISAATNRDKLGDTTMNGLRI